MSTAGYSASSPSSAAVLEFICLFTHDLRRKQKRWEDGRLKFHSFNNRVMVYDDRGGFVGDMHWRRDYAFGEGEEIELERGGIIVQVQDLVRRTEQDLSEMIDKRAKEKEQRQLQAVARARGPTSVLPPSMPRPVPSDHFQLRHRPLHRLIGTPSGHHGKALIPQESPYESRQQNAETPDDRAAKRRKYDDERYSKKGHAQALFGQTLTLSATPVSSMPARHQPRKEPSSDVSVDNDTRDDEQHYEAALREQPKSSLHFNQRKRDPRLALKGTKNTSSRSTIDQSHSPTLDAHPKRATIPASTEVIEIEDLSPLSSSDRPIATPEHKEIRAARISKRADLQPKDDLSERTLPMTKQRKAPKPRSKDVRQHVKASSAVVKPVDTEPALHGANESSRSVEITKTSAKPMVELRLKSKKKRGLLMMSDRSKLSVRPQSPETISADADLFEEIDQVVIEDRPHYTNLSHPEKWNKVSKNGDLPVLLDVSLELGEEEDPFRSPSPTPQKQRGGVTSGPDLEKNEKTDATRHSKQRNDTEADIETNHALRFENSVPLPVNALTQTKESRPSAHGCKQDLSRLPSSFPLEQPRDEHEELCTSPRRECTNDSRLFTVGHVTDEEVERSETENMTRPRKSRKTCRNIVLDDDEAESETSLKVTGDAVPKFEEQPPSDRSSGAVPLKQGKKLAKAVQRRKRRPTMQNEDSESDRGEGLPRKRRTLTRMTRSRSIQSELSLGSSEEESERDIPMRGRRQKVAQACEERPRLTKVKNSVKSRELIGFDLSALKVPLGPRGIGLPFSILSSPVTDSTEKRTTHNDATVISSDTGLENDGKQMQSDAGKAKVYVKETVKVSAPVLISGKDDEVQSDQTLPTGEATAKQCFTAESPSSRQSLERPQVQTKQELSPCHGGCPKDQDVRAVASAKQHCREKVGADSLQDDRTTTRSAQEDPKSHSTPPVDILSCQGGASDLNKEPSSMMQAPTGSPQYELGRIGPPSKLGAEDGPSTAVKMMAQRPSSKPLQDESERPEPIVIGARAPTTCRAGVQSEVEKAASAAAEPHQPIKAIGLRRTVSAVRTINNVQIETPPLQTPELLAVAEDSTKPVARIANPATRGRKAALRSHAAGQAPQRILPPTQPSLLVPISTADLALTPMEEPKKETERPKKKMAFPGFHSARGEGPWSREAFDLLESGRPE